MENQEAYHRYVVFPTNEIQFINIREIFDKSIAVLSDNIVAVHVYDCTKLHNFCANQKRNGRLGKWKDAESYNSISILIGQYN